MTSTPDYWDELPTDEQSALRKIASNYRGLIPGLGDDGSVPDYDAAVALLQLQRLETEVMEAHGDWLARTKAAVESTGHEWTHSNLVRYLRRHEDA